MLRKWFWYIALIVMITGLLAIPYQATAEPAPRIDSLSPSSGPIGTRVTVRGSGFTPIDNFILFNDFLAIPYLASSDGTTITFTIPPLLNPYCYFLSPPCLMPMMPITPGRYEIKVRNDDEDSNTVIFTVAESVLYLPLVTGKGIDPVRYGCSPTDTTVQARM